MYTVVRFSDPLGRRDLLEQFGRELNELIPGIFKGFDRGRRVGTRFSSPLLDSDDWKRHQDAIIEFFGKCKMILQEARESGLTIAIDMAIDVQPAEHIQICCFEVDTRLAEAIAQFKVPVIFSIYSDLQIIGDLKCDSGESESA